MDKELVDKLLTVGRVQGMFDILWVMGNLDGLSEEDEQRKELVYKELDWLKKELIETGTFSEEAENSLAALNELIVMVKIFGLFR